MKKRALYIFLLFLFSAFLYPQVPVIDENDIASLIPKNFYTYKVYDIAIRDIPDKVHNDFFAGSIFVERDTNNSTHLIEPYNTQGYITRENIVGLLNDMSQSEYVLFDECQEVYSNMNVLLYRKIRYNNKIIGEISLSFLRLGSISWPQV